MAEDPGLSLNAAVARIDSGQSSGTRTSDARRIKDLEREGKGLKRSNEILLAASSFIARELDLRLPWWTRSSTHRSHFGIAPSTFYASRTRPPSDRALKDPMLVAEISRVHGSCDVGRDLYGARKVWRHLQREGQPMARCTIERLMRANGMRGVVRGARVRTTMADDQASRPPDRVDRDFHAPCPDRHWVVDFTYVPT